MKMIDGLSIYAEYDVVVVGSGSSGNAVRKEGRESQAVALQRGSAGADGERRGSGAVGQAEGGFASEKIENLYV